MDGSARARYVRARGRANSGRPRGRIYARVLAPNPLICGLCHQPIDKRLPRGGRNPHPRSATVDHIIPVIDGGAELDPSNLQPAHRDCNLAKEAARRAARAAAALERVPVMQRPAPQPIRSTPLEEIVGLDP